MAYIEASGPRYGEHMTVRCESDGGPMTVNIDMQDRTFIDLILFFFDQEMEHCKPLGGTFYPSPGTLLCAYSVLMHGWFETPDGLPESIETQDLPEMESEPGRIY